MRDPATVAVRRAACRPMDIARGAARRGVRRARALETSTPRLASRRRAKEREIDYIDAIIASRELLRSFLELSRSPARRPRPRPRALPQLLIRQ